MKTTRPSLRAKRTDSILKTNGAPETKAAPLDILPSAASHAAKQPAPGKKKKLERKRRKERLGAMK